MFRTAPRLLALLVSSVCLLAKSAGAQPIGGIDSPVDGQTVSGIVRVSGFVLDLNTRRARSSSWSTTSRPMWPT